ncbi:MAG: ComEC/Rec2 family competence protein [Rhodobacterales bacterium]|nr:ComEC/Rec2 family competence protein [Rhodobacterales bacterium]
MRFWHAFAGGILQQRGYLFPWVPVFMAVGIAGYFSLRVEPSIDVFFWLGAGAALSIAIAARAGPVFAPFVWMITLVSVGFCLAGLRAHQVEGPVLGWRYYGAVEGRIVAIDRSASDAIRLTLDRVVLDRVAPAKTPRRVRISLHGAQNGGAQNYVDLQPGLGVMTTAHLSPPSGPVEPEGFDFQPHAWFQRIGGIGYSRVPVLAIAPSGGELRVFKWRMALSARAQAALSGEVGGFGAAIMTGDRSGIEKETILALRASNLAHLLAISGLHMGLLAGFVFAVFRLFFATLPWLGLRVPGKKLSAGMALMVAAAYLALSGGNVATERAFVMVAVALIAVVLDRRAFSLRAVATAAIIVLALRPEALLGPGFQMSFAATTALIAVFGLIRDLDIKLGLKWLRPVLAVVLSSAVAGAATGPVGAAHFNQLAHYGLLANLLSVPLMGVLVMPAAVVAALLLPLGLEGIALYVMGLGLRWILGGADFVANMEGAQGQIVSPAVWVLPLMASGFLFLILWQGRVRFVGVLPVLASVYFWAMTERPEILIADTGSLVGVLTANGRALSKPKGAGFVARNWLENDGDGVTQAQAAARWGGPIDLGVGGVLHQVSGKRATAAFDTCAKADLVVMNVTQPRDLPCRVIDLDSLRETGSLALYSDKTGLRIVSARDITGVRLWNK